MGIIDEFNNEADIHLDSLIKKKPVYVSPLSSAYLSILKTMELYVFAKHRFGNRP